MSLSHPTLFPLLSRTFTVTLSQCGYQCQPGYFCDATSLSSVANVCAAGQYSSGGASVCSQCARGYYGNATGLTSPSCSGPCPAGYSCPSGTGALPSLTASASPSPSPSVAPNLLTAAESAALADVYTALDGPHWTVSNGWLATGTVDEHADGHTAKHHQRVAVAAVRTRVHPMLQRSIAYAGHAIMQYVLFRGAGYYRCTAI